MCALCRSELNYISRISTDKIKNLSSVMFSNDTNLDYMSAADSILLF